jgi:hypothetical protein
MNSAIIASSGGVDAFAAESMRLQQATCVVGKVRGVVFVQTTTIGLVLGAV